ncbi:MAG TPA: hypothetical protein VHO28_10185, partial [Ignavibacteriales bacterium]|nr:hypothetical protein [Ignavibacteriales bacterium]
FLEIYKNSLSGFLYEFANLNFLYFCILLFVFSIAMLIIVSLLTGKPSEKQLDGLTFSTISAKDKAESRASWSTMDVVNTVIIVLIIISVFIYFSPLGIAG